MAGLLPSRLRSFWRRRTALQRLTLLVALAYALVWLLRAAGKDFRFGAFVGFFFYALLIVVAWRWVAVHKERLLWSLRSRLIVAYLFIAVVPVVLLLAMAGLLAYLVYSQLGAHLVRVELERRLENLATVADDLASRGNGTSNPSVPNAREAGLRVEFGPEASGGAELLRRGGVPQLRDGGAASGTPATERFVGLVQRGEGIELRAVVARPSPAVAGPAPAGARAGRGRIPQLRDAGVVSVSLPVDENFLDTLMPEMGPVQITVTRPATAADPPQKVLTFDNRRFLRVRLIGSRSRVLGSPTNVLDREMTIISNWEAVALEGGEGKPRESTNLVFVTFSARPSQMNRRFFTSLGQLNDLASFLLVAVGVVFLIIEVAALVTGVALTRTITRAVADLYRATERVQAGDFTHRVRTPQRDQLGSLGESFNAMTSSVAGLIEEQRQRQRLENELAIAQQVQAQLFPQALPSVPGLSLAAVCRAARVVSGDYYDFISLGPERLGIAIADISGKGISAALLMASLQAALRSQVLLDGNLSHNTAELVSRLNLHVYRNTSEERYATFFYASYDAATRMLQYTNAGHLPPFLVVGERVRKLEEGGMVVGLFDDVVYEQGSLRVEPGSLLVAYSDGLIEPENVFGEQFGIERLAAEVVRHRNTPVQHLAEMLVRLAEEWGGSQEQADDMTVIVARME